MIQFASSPRLEFALDLHANKQELMRHMKKISYRLVSLSADPSLSNGFTIVVIILTFIPLKR